MTRTSLLAATVLFLVAPSSAWANCEERLANAARAVGHMPHEVDFRVTDRLNEYYSEAEALVGSDEAACLAMVARMEALIRQNGGRLPGSTAGGAVSSHGGSPSQAPGLIAVTPPTSFARALSSRISTASPQRQAEIAALSDYVATVRQVGLGAAQQASASSASEANGVISSVNQAIEAAEGVQEVLINDRGDQLHAELEDAFRNFEEARDAVEQRANQTGSATPAQRAALRRATATLSSVRNRLNNWLLEELQEGRAPGYAAAFLALEAKHYEEKRSVRERCDVIFEAAYVTLAQDYGSGNRNSTAMDDAIGACRAINLPVTTRQEREMDELEARFAFIEDGDRPRSRRRRANETEEDYLAPLVRNDEDYIAPLVREDGGAEEDYIAPLVRDAPPPVEDYIAPLVRSAGQADGPGH